jgi:hypothetical protein
MKRFPFLQETFENTRFVLYFAYFSSLRKNTHAINDYLNNISVDHLFSWFEKGEIRLKL